MSLQNSDDSSFVPKTNWVSPHPYSIPQTKGLIEGSRTLKPPPVVPTKTATLLKKPRSKQACPANCYVCTLVKV
jgi:hypothetical protein